MNNPRNYSDAAIAAALFFDGYYDKHNQKFGGGSRKISFRYDLLNLRDIRMGNLDGITHAAVEYGEFRAIKRSATFALNEYTRRNINFLTDRIKPWFVLHMPSGGVVEWPLGIFLPESPKRDVIGSISTRDIGAFDKTIIVEQDNFTRREFFPAGTRYIDAARRILEGAGIMDIEIEESDIELPHDREYRIGTKLHLAINELLREINFEALRFDEYGTARSGRYIPPADRDITHKYETGKDSIVAPLIEEEHDIATRPNVFKRVALNLEDDTELVSEFINDAPESPISTRNRGRRITNYDTIHEIPSQEALDAFVRRVAIDNTTAFSHLSFGTALMPTHGSAETLLCIFPEVFDGPQKFHETSWEMPLVHDGEMRHTARRVVRL